MLSDYPLGARLPIGDYNRARAFHVDVLGLSPLGEVPDDGITFAPGNGTKMALYMVPQHDFRPVAAWEVDDWPQRLPYSGSEEWSSRTIQERA
jgi:hypothetical protein